MNTYIWESEYLRQYRRGFIVAHGATESEARQNAREEAEKYDREYNSLQYGPDQDEFDLESINDRMETLEADLRKDPTVIKTAMMIPGSE